MFGIGHARLFLLLYACLLDTATGMLKKRKRAVLAVPKSPYLRPLNWILEGFVFKKALCRIRVRKMQILVRFSWDLVSVGN